MIKNKRLLKHPNYIKVNESDLIRMSTYVGGHPNIDDQVLSVYAAKIDNNIVLF